MAEKNLTGLNLIKVDLEALAADVQEVEENGGGGDFEKVRMVNMK